jgi:hypothetical protein
VIPPPLLFLPKIALVICGHFSLISIFR